MNPCHEYGEKDTASDLRPTLSGAYMMLCKVFTSNGGEILGGHGRHRK